MARLPVMAEKLIYGMSSQEAIESMTALARRRAFVEYHIERIYDLTYELDKHMWLSSPKIWDIFQHIQEVSVDSRKTELFGYFQFSESSVAKFIKSLAHKKILDMSKERIGKGYAGKTRNFYRKAENTGNVYSSLFSPTIDKLDDLDSSRFLFNRGKHQFELAKPEKVTNL